MKVSSATFNESNIFGIKHLMNILYHYFTGSSTKTKNKNTKQKQNIKQKREFTINPKVMRVETSSRSIESTHSMNTIGGFRGIKPVSRLSQRYELTSKGMVKHNMPSLISNFNNFRLIFEKEYDESSSNLLLPILQGSSTEPIPLFSDSLLHDEKNKMNEAQYDLSIYNTTPDLTPESTSEYISLFPDADKTTFTSRLKPCDSLQFLPYSPIVKYPKGDASYKEVKYSSFLNGHIKTNAVIPSLPLLPEMNSL